MLTFLMLAAGLCGGLYAQTLPPQEIRRLIPDTIEGGITPKQIIALSNGEGFLATGTVAKYGIIARLNGCGEEVWSHLYLFGDETGLNGIAELPSGELVAAGSCLNCAPGDTTRKALVLKTDANGTILQDTAFGRLNLNASADAVIATNDGKAAVTGSLVIGSFLSPTNAFLTVLDGPAQPAFWREYHQLYYDHPQALAELSDGGFVLAGYSFASLFAPRQAQLFRTDSQGNLLWKNTSAYLNSQFNSVQETSGGEIAAFGQRLVDTVSNKDVYLAVHEPGSGILQSERLYGSPANDDGRSLHAVEGGYLAGGVWGEPRQPGWNVRDWIFRLDENFDLVEEDLYDSYLFAHSIVNAVPLSPDGKNFAYLSTLQFFANRTILFYKKTLQGRHAILSQAPLHYQLVPRNLASNTGEVVYEGSLGTPGYYDEMRLKVYRNDTLIQAYPDGTPQDFSFHVEIPAELANYTFRLLGVRNGQEEPETEACGVVAGDAYIIQGQSNASAGGSDSAYAYMHEYTPFVRTFGLTANEDTIMRWHNEAYSGQDFFADTRSGQWGLVLAKQIAAQQGIPVAILNGGIPGISIDSMLPNPEAPHSLAHHYGRFYYRVERSGLREHIRAVLFFQGETNAAPAFWDSVAEYKAKFNTLNTAWEQDLPGRPHNYLFQIRPGAYWAGATLRSCLKIEEAHRQIAEEYSEWDVMSSTGMNHDGTHYRFHNGYQRAGEDIYRLVARDYYGAADTPGINPPQVSNVYFFNPCQTEIALEFERPDDGLIWHPGWEADFLLEGDPGNSVASGHIEEGTLYLNLAQAPAPSFTGLSYASHAVGDACSVKNSRGIGLLAFYNYPVAPPTGQFNLAVERAGNTLTVAEEEADAYQWIDCTSGEAIPNATERSYTIVEDGVYAVIVSDGECVDTSACFEAQLPGPGQAAYPDPVFTEDFRQENGWQAGDATISVPLPNGKVLWLFGDSYVDMPYNPADTSLPCLFNRNNAIVIQDSAGLSYHMTLIPPTPGHFYWPGKGFYYDGKIYIFLFERTFSGGSLTFVGARYAELSYPGLELLGVHAIPTPEGIEFGKAAFVDAANGWLYIYGSKTVPFFHRYYAARSPLNNLMQEWSYWNGSTWALQPGPSAYLPSPANGCPSFSVFPHNGKYYMLSQDNGYLTCGLGRDIKLYTADAPQGPFNFFELVYTVEDTYEGQYLATYNAQAHPEIGGDLLVSYNLNDVNLSNSGCPRQCSTGSRFNADTYRPKFVRMSWPNLLAGLPTPGNGLANRVPDEPASFSLWPNPSKDGQVTLAGNLKQKGRLLIMIYSADGRLVSRNEQMAPAGSFGETLRLPVTPGLYLVTVQSEAGERQVFKVMRTRD